MSIAVIGALQIVIIITFCRVDQFSSELVNWLKPTNSVVKCKVIGQFYELVNSVSQIPRVRMARVTARNQGAKRVVRIALTTRPSGHKKGTRLELEL